MMMMMTMLSYPMRKQQMEMLMKQNKGKDGNRYPMIEYIHTYIHTYIGSSPRGFSESNLHYAIKN